MENSLNSLTQGNNFVMVVKERVEPTNGNAVHAKDKAWSSRCKCLVMYNIEGPGMY